MAKTSSFSEDTMGGLTCIGSRCAVYVKRCSALEVRLGQGRAWRGVMYRVKGQHESRAEFDDLLVIGVERSTTDGRKISR